jgi:hypothetical protein
MVPVPATHLLLVRRVERLAAHALAVRSRLEAGPFERQRKRLRRQLRKLADVLTRVQAHALATAAGDAVTPDVTRLLPDAEALIEALRDGELSKPRLRAARHDVKRTRRALAATLD